VNPARQYPPRPDCTEPILVQSRFRNGCTYTESTGYPIKVLAPIMVLDLRSVVWGEDPIRQWILRNVVDSRFISEPTSDLEDTRPEYRIPQFIADLARRRTFRGIKYDSTRPSAYNNPEAAGYNLVVFDHFPAHVIEHEATIEFGEPDYDPFSLERWLLRGVGRSSHLLRSLEMLSIWSYRTALEPAESRASLEVRRADFTKSTNCTVRPRSGYCCGLRPKNRASYLRVCSLSPSLA
jgi:hypothetical protein